MVDGVPDGEHAGEGSFWTAFDLGKSCVRQIKKGPSKLSFVGMKRFFNIQLISVYIRSDAWFIN